MEAIKNLITMVSDIEFTIRAYLIAGFTWALAAVLLASLNQVQFFLILDLPPALDYGYARPLFALALIFGALLSFFFAAAYHIIKTVTGANPKLALAAWAGFKLHQFALVLGIVTILAGYNAGREYGEMTWISDNLLVIALALFLATAIEALKSSGKSDMAATYSIVAAAGGLIVYLLGNIGLPTGPLTHVPLFRGMEDAAIQEFYRTGVLGYFILFPLFTMLYFFIPSYYKAPLYSERMAAFTVFGMLVMIPFAAAAGLALSAAPALLQTQGVFASIALAAAILAGGLNAQYTISRSEKHYASDAIGLMMRYGVFFLMATAILRAVMSPFFMQAHFAYTGLNLRDLGRDGLTYGLLIAMGASLIVAQKITNRTMSKGTVKIAAFTLGMGALLIFIGDLAQGFIQGGVQSETAVENGVTSVVISAWSEIIFAGTLYQGSGEAGQFLLSLSALHFVGVLLITIGTVAVSFGFYLLMAGAGTEGYSEPDLVNKNRIETPVPAAAPHGAH
ncbi:MAG: cbb3-type cytochrome c oxidase subunit I [Leptospirales bacterium]|jgi:cbb3-type cytochrome oxidase subunit 1